MYQRDNIPTGMKMCNREERCIFGFQYQHVLFTWFNQTLPSELPVPNQYHCTYYQLYFYCLDTAVCCQNFCLAILYDCCIEFSSNFLELPFYVYFSSRKSILQLHCIRQKHSHGQQILNIMHQFHRESRGLGFSVEQYMQYQSKLYLTIVSKKDQ